MKVKLNIQQSIFLSILALILIGCRKEDAIEKQGVSLGKILLTEKEKQLIPYSVGDTLNFIDSVGNAITYKVKYRNLHVSRYYKDGGTDASTDFYEIERVTIGLFSESKNSFTLVLKAPLPGYVSNTHISKNTLTIVGSFANNELIELGAFLDTADFYYNWKGDHIPFLTDWSRASNIYNNVFQLSDAYGGELFYNQKSGIVGFDLKNGSRWHLE